MVKKKINGQFAENEIKDLYTSVGSHKKTMFFNSSASVNITTKDSRITKNLKFKQSVKRW